MKQLKFLLPKDFEEKEKLERYIKINENYKIPNKDVEVEFHCQFLRLEKELDYRSYILKREYTEDEFIKDYIKRNYKRYVLDSYEFVGVFDESKRFVGKMHEALGQFVEALDKLEFFEKIESEMYNYFDNHFNNLDFRNLYQKRDGIYLGTRGIPSAIEDPLFDQRMLGVLLQGNDRIMTTKEYHSQIRKIKKELNARKQN
jgi:hypothetical protein